MHCVDAVLGWVLNCVLTGQSEGVIELWPERMLVAGTIMVTYGDAKQGDSSQLNTVGGDLLVLLSGLCYAAYTVRHAPPV